MLQGLSAFSVTPTDPMGRVDTDHLQRLVARIASASVASIGVLGSTGSYMYLDKAERDRALRAAMEAADGKPVLAGIGAMRTSDVLHYAKTAEAAGAAAALLPAVSYIPLTDNDFFCLVREVSENCGLPICLYNNPGTTHFNMSQELVARLAKLDRVAAVKNPAPRTVEEASAQMQVLREKTLAGFVLGYSGDALIAGPLQAGADAWYSVLAGTLTDLALALWDARKDPARLAALNERCAPIWSLFNQYGSIRVVPHMLNAMGQGPVSSPLPLQPLPKDAQSEIDRALDAVAHIVDEGT